MVFQRLTGFIQSLGKNKNDFGDDDPRIAVVALLFYIVDADGEEQGEERQALKDIVAREYALAGDELKTLIEAGRQAHRDSIDLFVFTSTLKRHLTPQQCVAFIGLLWEIAFADGHVYELEENLVWRIAELIGVDRDDRLALKKQVAQRLNLQPDQE
ncbi:tellurite resistance TerB family protein [Bartonella sp. LJL80]